MRLAERAALVTGAGDGAFIALALAQEGADVSVNYVSNETPAQQLAEEIKQMGRQAILERADVSDAGHLSDGPGDLQSVWSPGYLGQ